MFSNALNKYLGVTLTSNLSWDKHVENVAAKGNITLGIIRRNLKDCTRTVKETSYTAIVRPIIEYAATVWDPTRQSKIKAMENIQKAMLASCPAVVMPNI
jgi:hypothetical protein